MSLSKWQNAVAPENASQVLVFDVDAEPPAVSTGSLTGCLSLALSAHCLLSIFRRTCRMASLARWHLTRLFESTTCRRSHSTWVPVQCLLPSCMALLIPVVQVPCMLLLGHVKRFSDTVHPRFRSTPLWKASFWMPATRSLAPSTWLR